MEIGEFPGFLRWEVEFETQVRATITCTRSLVRLWVPSHARKPGYEQYYVGGKVYDADLVSSFSPVPFFTPPLSHILLHFTLPLPPLPPPPL